MVLIFVAPEILEQVAKSAINERMLRDSLIDISFTVLESPVFAMLG